MNTFHEIITDSLEAPLALESHAEAHTSENVTPPTSPTKTMHDITQTPAIVTITPPISMNDPMVTNSNTAPSGESVTCTSVPIYTPPCDTLCETPPPTCVEKCVMPPLNDMGDQYSGKLSNVITLPTIFETTCKSPRQPDGHAKDSPIESISEIPLSEPPQRAAASLEIQSESLSHSRPIDMQNLDLSPIPSAKGIERRAPAQSPVVADNQSEKPLPPNPAVQDPRGQACPHFQPDYQVERSVLDSISNRNYSKPPTTTSVPNNNHITKVLVDKSTITTVDMATQTGPKEISDPPVKQTEFSSQLEYVDGTLTNHERRIRTTEIWREKQDRKVDKIDADFYTLYIDLRASQGLQKVVEDLIMVTPNYEKLIVQAPPAVPRAEQPVLARPACIPDVNLTATCSPDQPANDATPAERSAPVSATLVQPATRSSVSKPVSNGTLQVPQSTTRTGSHIPEVQFTPVVPMPTPTIPPYEPPKPSQKPANIPKPRANPNVEKGAIEKRGGTGPGVGKSPELCVEKKSACPADIFLKEARKVIPNARARRNSNRQNRPGSQSSGSSTRAVKTAPSANPYTVALDNMFSPLESQVEGAVGPVTKVPANVPPTFSTENFPPFASRAPPKALAASTPAPKPGSMNQSWADYDNDDSKAIEAFLANTPIVQKTMNSSSSNVPGKVYSRPSNAPQQEPRPANQNEVIELDNFNRATNGLGMHSGQQSDNNMEAPKRTPNQNSAAPNQPKQPGRGGAVRKLMATNPRPRERGHQAAQRKWSLETGGLPKTRRNVNGPGLVLTPARQYADPKLSRIVTFSCAV